MSVAERVADLERRMARLEVGMVDLLEQLAADANFGADSAERAADASRTLADAHRQTAEMLKALGAVLEEFDERIGQLEEAA